MIWSRQLPMAKMSADNLIITCAHALGKESFAFQVPSSERIPNLYAIK